VWCDIGIDYLTNTIYNDDRMEIEMYSELELLVMKDMIELDFDPLNEADVKLYWETMLG